MEKRFRFTWAKLNKLCCPDGSSRIEFQDQDRPELLIQITKTGAKSYYCRCWNPAKGYTDKIYIGKHNQIDLTQARIRAREIATLSDQGKEPTSDRKKLREEITFAEAFGSFITKPATRQKKGPWRTKTIEEYQAQYERYLAERYGSRKLSTIHRAEIDDLHTRLGTHNGKYAANRAISLISGVFNDSIRKGWDGTNPASGIERFAEKRRDRFLDEHEIGPFIHACAVERESGSPLIADAVLVALFTGLRRRNVCAAAWNEIDLEHGMWHIPDSQMKNREPHVVYLCKHVREILWNRYRHRTSDTWVFPGIGKTGHLTEPKKGITRIATLADINPQGINMHCLKHTFVTYADDLGLPSAVRKRLAAHKHTQDVTEGYTHTLERRVRESYDQVAQHMLKFVEREVALIAGTRAIPVQAIADQRTSSH